MSEFLRLRLPATGRRCRWQTACISCAKEEEEGRTWSSRNLFPKCSCRQLRRSVALTSARLDTEMPPRRNLRSSAYALQQRLGRLTRRPCQALVGGPSPGLWECACELACHTPQILRARQSHTYVHAYSRYAGRQTVSNADRDCPVLAIAAMQIAKRDETGIKSIRRVSRRQ